MIKWTVQNQHTEQRQNKQNTKTQQTFGEKKQ